MLKESPRPQPSTKVFIEADEEIVFVVEKILEAPGDRIILIVVKHAALTSSLVNLKLLSRCLIGKRKTIILVSDSDLAQNKQEETSIIAVEKIEDINESIWDKAKSMLDELNEKRKKIKNELIEARQESSVDNDSYEESEEEEIIESNDESVDEEQAEELPIHSHNRLPGKFVKAGAFEILVGEDIRYEEIAKEDKKIQTPFKKPEIVSQPVVRRTEPSAAYLTGRDFTKTSAVRQTVERGARGNISTREVGKYVKPLIIFAIVLGAYLYLSKYLLKATITITTEAQERSISKDIIASTSATEVSLDSNTIPMKLVTVTRSSSDTAMSTGTADGGTYAIGVVDITNKTDKAVTIAQGTIIKTFGSNLEFEVTQAVTVNARLSELTPSTHENVPIRARGYGENYNVGSVDVSVGNYKPNTEVSGRIYKQVQGGTSKKLTVVSQQDVDTLKNSLSENIKTLLRDDIKTQLTQGDITLPASEKFEEKAFELSKKVGEESPNFDISKLEIQYSVYVVNQTNLDNLADQILSKENQGQIDDQTPVSATVDSISKIDENKYNLKIKKTTKVTPTFDNEKLFETIKDKKSAEAEVELEKIDGVANAEISFSPFFAPPFYKIIPRENSKVTIKFETAE